MRLFLTWGRKRSLTFPMIRRFVAGFGAFHVKICSPEFLVKLSFHVDRTVGISVAGSGVTRVLVSQTAGRLLQRLYGLDISFPFGHRSNPSL